MTKVQRYKVGFFQDEWGMSSITPCLIPDDSGFAVKFEDYFKLEAENERLKAELAKYRDAPVVAWVEVVDSYEGPYHFNGEKLLNVGKHKLIVKPGEEK